MWYSPVLEWDLSIFRWINTEMGNGFFDLVFPLLRSKYIWMPLYVFIAGFFLINFRKEGLKLLILTFLVIGLSDGISSQLIKKNVARSRPCNNITVEVVQRVECGSGYSFTSSHAANHFSLSVFLILSVFRKRWIAFLLLLWAALVSFAQVYVGVHYPSDVLAGAILGVVIAILVYRFLGSRLRISPYG